MKGIYKITNKKNGKVYIGQSIHCGKRLDEHCVGDQLIDTIMQEEGYTNFTFEILKEVENDKDLSYWEDYYITMYNSLYPNGYNKRMNTALEMTAETKVQNNNFSKNKDNSIFLKFYSNVRELLKRETFNARILMYLIYTQENISFEKLRFVFYGKEQKYYIKQNLLMLEEAGIIDIDNDSIISLRALPKEVILTPFFKSSMDIIQMQEYNSRIVLLVFLHNVMDMPINEKMCIKLFPKRYEKEKSNKKFIYNCFLEVQCKYPFLKFKP